MPKTKIFSIDNILEYMKSEAEGNKIEIELEINTNVNELIDSIIEKGKLVSSGKHEYLLKNSKAQIDL